MTITNNIAISNTNAFTFTYTNNNTNFPQQFFRAVTP